MCACVCVCACSRMCECLTRHTRTVGVGSVEDELEIGAVHVLEDSGGRRDAPSAPALREVEEEEAEGQRSEHEVSEADGKLVFAQRRRVTVCKNRNKKIGTRIEIETRIGNWSDH